MLKFNIKHLYNSIKNFLKFYFKATNLYNVHSPFVYEFINFVFTNKLAPTFSKTIDELRSSLKNSNEVIDVMDLGAGSRSSKPVTKDKISRIARTAVSGKLKSRWLHNICAYFQPNNLLEMGTSLGLSASYLSQNTTHLTTLEGNPSIAKVAKDILRQQNIQNVEVIPGNFDVTLSETLQTKALPDMVYLDGNHTYEATIRYFHQLMASVKEEEMILIFDDIYWSEGMMQAWEEIKSNTNISLSIDIYFFGLIFFKTKTIAPKHYKLLPAKWKLWHLGFKPVR